MLTTLVKDPASAELGEKVAAYCNPFGQIWLFIDVIQIPH